MEKLTINQESKVEKVLDFEERKNLAEAWLNNVVGEVERPDALDSMDDEKYKKWLYESLIGAMDDIVDGFCIEVDDNLIEKIKQTSDPFEKSALEWKYIEKCHIAVDDLVKNFDRSGQKSRKWDSWPKKIRESGEFNCVGATLIGENLLRRAGIESFCGNPPGHVLNIARLENGDWVYADFVNGDKALLKLKGKEQEIEGKKVLFVNEHNLDYKMIPLNEYDELVGTIIGNLGSLRKASNNESSSSQIEGDEAKQYILENNDMFEKNDFSDLYAKLFSDSIKFFESSEYKKEKERIGKIRRIQELRTKKLKNFNKEDLKEIMNDLRKHRELLALRIREDGWNNIEDMSQRANEFVNSFIDILKEVCVDDRGLYEEELEKFIYRISEF